jgi:hypothetical protein
MPATLFRTASSTVAQMRNGQLLEVRRGELRGAAIMDKRVWDTQEAWLDAIGEPLLPVSHALEVIQAFRQAGIRLGAMRPYGASAERFCIQHNQQWQRWNPDSPRCAELEASNARIREMIAFLADNHYYTPSRRTSDLFVDCGDGMLKPVYYNVRKNLIGIPDLEQVEVARSAMNVTYQHAMLLRTGRSFEEIGVTPISWWRKSHSTGCIVRLETPAV